MKVHSPEWEQAKLDGYVFQKLPAKIKRPWLKALESGEYKQGQDQLGCRPTPRHKPRYCCLGVGCEVIPMLKKQAVWVISFSNEPQQDLQLGRRSNSSDWTGFLEETGLDPKAHTVLVELNDNGATFKEIAAWIRENL